MKHHDAPCRIFEQISIQRIGTETLLYDERRHQAFCLNQSSSVIWQLANGANSIAQIAAEASVQLQSSVTEEFVLFALDQLRTDGLIHSSSHAESTPAISRRAITNSISGLDAATRPAASCSMASCNAFNRFGVW